MKAVDKLIQRQKLTKEEFIEILKQQDDPDIRELLKEEAVRLRKHYYGTKVFTRGLIEFTNHCKNDCYYCGIRRSNKNAKRFRLSQEDILACCENGYELGFRTFAPAKSPFSLPCGSIVPRAVVAGSNTVGSKIRITDNKNNVSSTLPADFSAKQVS